MATTRIEGAAELDKVLKALPKRMGERALVAAVRAGANIIRDEARARVPVGTGRLRDEIVVKRIRTGQASLTMRLGPLRSSFYGMFFEFGTSIQAARPFLRPAFDAKVGEALGALGTRLGKRVEAEAKKLAGPLAKAGLVKRRRRR